MQIICTIATEKTKELAKSIDKSVSVTQTMIDTWRTYHPDTEKEYPTVDDLQEYLKANTETKKAIYFAVPRYYFQEYNPNEPIIQTDNKGDIILMAFPGNSLGYFWNKTGNNPNLRKIITNTNDAYRWLLWREMALVQRGGERTDDNIAIAEKEATDKMREWKKEFPDQTASTLLDIVLSKFGSYFEGSAPLAQDYPNIPDELVTKVGSYIMGGGVEYARPTEAEALKFLQAADPSLIPANVLATVERQRQQASQSNIPQLEPAPPQASTAVSPKKQTSAIPKSTTGETIVYVTGEAKTTKYTAMKNGAIDTLRHPNEQGMHFGNPFSHANYEGTIKVGSVKEAAEAYDAWLRGDEYYNGIKLALVDPERRQWIVNRILSGELKGKTLIYYTNSIPDFSYGVENYDPETAPNHAHILADYINGKRQVINEDVSSQRKTGIPAVDDAMDVIDRYSTWQRANLSFDKETHTYFFRGKPTNTSVTGYMERVYGKPNIIGDYAFTQSMGNDTDKFTRDYFLQRFNLTINPMRNKYPNLSDKRKTELLKSEQRLENYLKHTYGQNCKIITRDMILAAKIKTDRGEETIAGAPDMIVIDEQGDLHLLDMKAKAHPIDRMIKGKVSDDRRNYTFQLNAYRQLIEACMPEFQGKVKDLTLIWFDQSYPKQMVTIDGRTYGEATYVTDPKTGAVTVSDRETDNQPLYLYYKWHTPALKEDIKQSLISLSMDKSPLENVRPIQSREEIAVQEYKERQQPVQTSQNQDNNLAPTTEELNTIFPIGVQGTPSKNVLRSFTGSTVDTPDSQLPQQVQQQITGIPATDNGVPQDTTPDYNIPEIGANAINLDESSEMAKLTLDFNPMQLHDREENMARMFSEKVTSRVQQLIAENAQEMAEEMQKENKDMTNINRLYQRAKMLQDADSGRKFAIQDLTLKGLFDSMREEYEDLAALSPEDWEEEVGKGKGEYYADAYQKIVEHFDEILKGACNLIEGRENIRIIVDKGNYDTGTTQEVTTTGHLEPTEEDMEKEEAEFGDDPEGERVEGNAGWYYKVRMVNPLTSMSKDVKNTIYGVLKFGADGKPEYDDLGNPRYINGEYAHAVLINSLSNMISPDDFSYKDDDGEVHFPALERLQVKYPWVSQIIRTLKANPRVVSAFYADLRKDFIPYWIQVAEYNEDGTIKGYKNVPVNKPVARESAKDSMLDNYEQGTVIDVNSVYDSGRVVNKENAKLGNTLVGSLQTLLNDFDEEYTDEEDYNNIVANSVKVFRMVGMGTEESEIKNLLKSTEGVKSLENAVSAAGRIFEGILDSKFDDKAHLIQAFNSDYNVIAEEIGLVQELNNISSFRIEDDTYYSYSAPNYMDTLFKNLSNSDEERRAAYLNTQFGQYKWFKNPETGEWNCTWLEQIENDEDVRDHMELKELKALPNPDVAKRDLIQYKDWTPNMIRTAFVREYFSAGFNEKSKKQYGWYNFPIFSDSPVAKFIKFTRYVSDEEGTFKDKILPLLAKVAYQELDRMALVQERKKKGVREISNFDDNGDKFNFFPELNAYRAEIDAYIEEGDTNKLHEFLLDKIEELMNTNYLEFLENSAAVREEMIDHLKREGVAKTDQEAENAIEEYFWNQAFATTQIIELCTTDLAYYKDSIDFQKRFKEVYAAGTKVNTNSEYGKKIERTLYLADQIVTSSSYTDIKTSLDRAVEEGRIQNFDRDNILNKMMDIDATDAQAYRSLPSMRSLLDMLGKWDDNMEDAFNRFEHPEKYGGWTMADFNLVWQTIKPFVFTQIGKPDGVGGRMKVPHQNKNSEFLLLAMYRLIAGSEGKSAKLRAIDRFMKDNDVDVMQFATAVKAGGQGVIDISYSEKKLNDWKENNEDEAKKIDDAAKKNSKYSSMSNPKKFKAGNDYLLAHGEITQEEYNKRMNAIEPDEQEVYDILEQYSKGDDGEFLEDVLHEIPYDDYCIQQPTPEHLVDHIAVFGSQFRNLIIADMPNDPNFRVKINGRDYTKEEVLHLYNSLIVENLLDDWKKLRGKFETIESFQKALEDTVKGNPKYGRDILNAIQLVDDGEGGKTFNIPLDNPSTTLKIQEIVTSMFKNAIAKQSIKGGACILVSDFGLTSELHLRHDKETGALTGVECYMPASSREFFEPLMVEKTDENGNKYMELDISKLPKDLRKAIGYRIPTEDKYSMAPLIIKGFLPQQNGSAIMLPADITTIAGSDFDVDKMFLMFYEFDVFTHDKNKARADYDRMMQISNSIMGTLESTEKAKEGAKPKEVERVEKLNNLTQEVAREINNKSENAGKVKETVKNYTEEDIDDPTFNEWFDSLSEEEKDKYKYDTPQIVKKKYDINKSPQEQRRAQRNNMIIDIAYAILTHPRTSESFHNPGSFDTAKIAGRVARISTNVELLTAFAIDNKLGTAEEPDLVAAGRKLLEIERKGDLGTLNKFLKKHTKERSQLTPETFVYNHYQNMTGGALIGMYANNTSMQAKFQGTRLALKDDFTFTINGYKMKSLHDIFSERGERISKNCANFSAASVDNVKDPILADLMQNKDTANIAGTMLRLGMSIEEVGLLFSQPAIKGLILERGNLKDLKDYIKQAIDDLKEAGGGVNTVIASKNFTSEELMDNITKNHMNLSQEDALALRARQIQALKLMEQIMKISDDVGELTRISRADSPTAAIDTSIAGAKSQVKRVERFLNRAKKRDKNNPFTLVGVEDGLKNEYVNSDMPIDELREKFLHSRVPLLQAFYSLGIEFGNSLMGKYFSQSSPRTDAMVDFLYDMSAYGMVDSTLLNKFYSELVLFALTKSPLFGDDPDGVYDSNKTTYEEKRDYYLYDFPKEYLRIIADNPDIAEMQIFKRIQVVDGSIIMKRQGKLTTYMRDSLMRDFDMLLYMDNPDALKLATGLFMYAFYKDGFKFGPQSFGHLFSTSYVTSFPEFTQVLRNLKKDLKDKNYFDEYLPQFIANHWREANFIPILKERENRFTGRDEDITVLKDGRIQVASKRVLNRNLDINNLKPGYSISYPYIIYKSKLYILQDASSTNSFYVEAPIINSGDKGALRYNANSTASKMSEIKTDNKRVAANKEINPSNKGFGYDDAAFAALEAAFGGEGSDVFDAVAAYMEGGGDIGDDYLSYIENAPDYSPEDGEATLDQPVCK